RWAFMVPKQCQEVRYVSQESRPDGVRARREATLARQPGGKRAPGAKARVERPVGAGRALSAALSPALHESLDCPYKYRAALWALLSVGLSVHAAHQRPEGSATLQSQSDDLLRTTRSRLSRHGGYGADGRAVGPVGAHCRLAAPSDRPGRCGAQTARERRALRSAPPAAARPGARALKKPHT